MHAERGRERERKKEKIDLQIEIMFTKNIICMEFLKFGTKKIMRIMYKHIKTKHA